MGAKKRQRVEHTEELLWDQLELLLDWPEQVEYEKIRPIVVYGYPVPGRAGETSTSERTLHRRVESFDAHGMEGLISLEPLRGRKISVAMRLRIIELKAEYPVLPRRDRKDLLRTLRQAAIQTHREAHHRGGSNSSATTAPLQPLPCDASG